MDGSVPRAGEDAGVIAYRRDGIGAPLLCLHGNGSSSHEFVAVSAELAGEFDVVAWDMPGHGDSDPLSAVTIAALADSCAQLAEAVFDRPAIVAGASVGAFVAAELANRRPDLVAGLVLIEANVHPPAWWRAAWPTVEQMFGVEQQSIDQVQARFVRVVDSHDVERWNLDRARAGADQMVAVMEALRAHDLPGCLDAVTTPTVLVYGDEGPAIETMSELVAHAGTAGPPIVVGRCGHFVTHEHPSAVADAVRRVAAGGGRLRIVIDADRCIGSENCVRLAAHTFDLDDAGTAMVTDPHGDNRAAVELAAQGCPTAAITLIQDESEGART